MNLLILSLASYRVTRLLVRDTLTEPIRVWLGKRASSQRLFWWFLAEIFHCSHCMGMWVSGLLAMTLHLDTIDWFLYSLAIAGFQSIITEFLDA